jgi:ABC-type transport system involved in cytochrome c biogenesis permease subunit
MLNHLGLFLALTTATLGCADMQRVKMICGVGEPEWRALTQGNAIKEMPIAIELKKFVMETYDNGSPKRFASEIQILTKTGKNIETIVEVNKPYEIDGWKIYQYGYDTQMGAMSQTSILELVNDPWLPLVYSGIYLMLAGVLLLLIYTRWSYKRLLPMAALIVVALAIVSYFIPIFRSTKLVPALQSPWFTPHILVYIICYSLMGVAAVTAIWTLAVSYLPKTKSQKPNTDSQKPKATLDNLVYVGLIFMTFGMMFGAFWAKEAWGHYWSWDPKETWAAITWFSYLIYIHYRQLPRQNSRLALWLLILSFILLQMCWWGINYLPSAQGISIHTYN